MKINDNSSNMQLTKADFGNFATQIKGATINSDEASKFVFITNTNQSNEVKATGQNSIDNNSIELDD